MAELVVVEPPQPGRDIVELLEELLDRARSGEFSSVAVAAVLRDGSPETTWTEMPLFLAQLGAIHRLSHRLQRQRDEEINNAPAA